MANKFLLHTLFLTSSLSLVACQSTSNSTHKTQVKTRASQTLTAQPSRSSRDGVQDIIWKIKVVHKKQTKFFNQTPYLLLNSTSQTLQGHTGCNTIYGRYTFNLAQQQMTLDARAGHQSCDGALAQEAELMDSMQRVNRFKVQGQQLWLFDQRGQVVLEATSR